MRFLIVALLLVTAGCDLISKQQAAYEACKKGCDPYAPAFKSAKGEFFGRECYCDMGLKKP
jgi:hypothetical protein